MVGIGIGTGIPVPVQIPMVPGRRNSTVGMEWYRNGGWYWNCSSTWYWLVGISIGIGVAWLVLVFKKFLVGKCKRRIMNISESVKKKINGKKNA